MNAPFVLEVDLRTFKTRGCPRPLFADNLVVAYVGYVSSAQRSLDPEEARLALCAAYTADGAMLSASLLGQFAAVIVDANSRRVLLVQDSLGLRTLYYRVSKDRLIAATHLVAVASEEPAIHVDEAYFAEYLASGNHALKRTPIQEIARLSCGETVVVTAAGSTTLRPWSPPTTRSGRRSIPAQTDFALELRRLVDEAVGGALPRHGSVVCELSGGLDSSSVFTTALKAGVATEPLTLTSSGGRYTGEDQAYAAQMAEAAGTTWHRLDVDAFAPCSKIADALSGEPGGETLVAIQNAYAAELAAADAAVVLTGHGGDLVFGYGGLPPMHIGNPLVQGRIASSIAAARRWAAANDGLRPWTYYFSLYAVAPAFLHLRGRSLMAHLGGAPPRWLSRPFLDAHGLGDRTRMQRAPRVPLPGMQYLWEHAFTMANAQAVLPYRATLRTQTRHPLFHRPLVEFMFGVDPHLRSNGSQDRVLQRMALCDRLPEFRAGAPHERQRWPYNCGRSRGRGMAALDRRRLPARRSWLG